MLPYSETTQGDDMNVFLWLTTSVVIVMAIASLFHFKQLYEFIDDLRQRHKMVPYMVLMVGWCMVLMYGVAWLLILLDKLGLPVRQFTSWLFDFFVI